jgi:hypothetical protein
MSYHDGQNYNELSESEKRRCSLYLTFIFLTSLLVHDFIHADLHTGNWKIINGNKILLYDCGIMCSTNNRTFNKELVDILFSGRFDRLLYFISNSNFKKLKECEDYFNSDAFKLSSADRLRVFVNKLIENRLCSNKNIINILNAFAIIGEIYEESSSIFIKYITLENDHSEFLIYIYIGLLTRINKFKDLLNFLEIWMNSDKIHKGIYYKWLMDNFGHTKAFILDNIIYSKFSFNSINAIAA